MRFSAILPFLCAVAALVLSLLCLLAGSPSSFLPNAELLTVNTSRLGHTSLFNTSDGDGGFFSSIINSIEGDINKLLDDVTSDIARAFDIHDFYTGHVMNFCEGYYEPNTTVTREEHPHENITYCSNRTAFFHFDPTTIIERELKPGINLTDILWPHQIEEAIHAVEVATKVMFVFYVIGIIFAGFAVVGALFGIFREGRASAMLNFLLDILAFLTLGIASAIATVLMVKAVNAVNKYGNPIGVAAYKGKEFLGMTWAATAVMLLASIIWVADCCAGRRKGRRFGEKTSY